jgi:release factor glutamine methyltransferase
VADRTQALTAAVAARLRAAGCVFAEEEARLLVAAAGSADDLSGMVSRRAAGLPLEHVLGWAEFCGLRIAVDPGVFVPRRRTEFLVRQAVLLGRQGTGPAAAPAAAAGLGAGPPGAPPALVVVDLCCGSGAVGAALAAALAPVELHAADIDPAAVACARRNLAAAAGRVYLGDLYQPLPPGLRGRIAILAANVPYVPSDEVSLLPAEAREHEPRTAVDGGADGLGVLRRVAQQAPSWLAPGGRLLSEISERQAPQAAEGFARAGLTPEVAASEELNATVIIGTWNGGRRNVAGPGSTAPPPRRGR